MAVVNYCMNFYVEKCKTDNNNNNNKSYWSNNNEWMEYTIYIFFFSLLSLVRLIFFHEFIFETWLQRVSKQQRPVKQMSFDEYAFSNKCFGFNFIMRCIADKISQKFPFIERQQWHIHHLPICIDEIWWKIMHFVWFTCHNFRGLFMIFHVNKYTNSTQNLFFFFQNGYAFFACFFSIYRINWILFYIST